MIRSTSLALTLLACTACRSDVSDSSTRHLALRPGSTEPAQISLHALPGNGMPGPEFSPLFVAAWSDGTVCWSMDRWAGGAPYRAARIEPERVHEVSKKLCAKLRSPPGGLRDYWELDSGYWEITALDGDQAVGMTNSLAGPYAELNNVVATDHGIEPLGDRSRSSVEKSQSPALREFLATWRDCFDLVWSLVPQEDHPLGAESFEYVRR